MTIIIGTSKKDTLKGGSGNDSISGLAGDDKLYGNAGDDTLLGGDGKDLLVGGDGKDWLLGENGDDGLDGGAGNDQLFGEAGIDSLAGGDGDDYLAGGADDDRLEGGAGNDVLVGDDGNDTYVLAKGGGSDSVEEYAVGDRIELGSGVKAGDLVFRSGFRRTHTSEGFFSYSDLIVQLKTGESLRLDSFFESEPKDLVLADGTRIDYDFIKAAAMTGTKGDDLIRDTADDDEIQGGKGNDTITCAFSSDTVLGGAGNDVLSTELSASSLLDGGAGDDLLKSGAAGAYIDTLMGGTGNDTLLGEGGDLLFGGDGGDSIMAKWVDHGTVDAGGGNDLVEIAGALASSVVQGGDGDDVIRLHDVRDEASLRLGDTEGIDRVEWSDLSAAEFSAGLRRQGQDLAARGLLVENWFTSPEYHIERFVLADGSFTDDQIDALIGAMAGFAPQAGAQQTALFAPTSQLAGSLAAT